MLKTVIVTGGNSGLGLECAKNIARASKDYQIILACRNKQNANAAKEEVINETKNDNIIAMELDVSSLESVRKFAQDFVNIKDVSLYGLVCNAAISGLKSSANNLSKDGYDLMFATNHLGHFTLSLLLLPYMQPQGRIAVVSSDMHNPPGGVQWPGVQALAYPGLDNQRSYSLSKLCTLYFVYELAGRLKQAGSKIAINAFNPGLMTDTGLFPDKSMFTEEFLKHVADRMGDRKTSALSLASMITEDSYSGVSGVYVDRGQIIKSSPLSYDKQNAKELWDESVKLCKLNSSQTLEGIF